MARPIRYGGDPIAVDLSAAEQAIGAYAGKTVVEMLAPPERTEGGLFLAQTEDSEWAYDLGVVLSVGDGVALLPGDLVLVDAEHGKAMSGLVAGGYRSKGQVRLFGCAAQSGGKAIEVPWNRSILALINRDSDVPVRATHGNVVIDRGPETSETASGIVLPDSFHRRECLGTVVSVGLGVDPAVKVGAKVACRPGTARKVEGIGDDRLAIVVGEDVLLVQSDDGEWLAAENYVVVDRGEVVDRSAGGIYLPDDCTFRESQGDVLSVGSKVHDILPDDHVVYMANLMIPLKTLLGLGHEGANAKKDLGVTPAAGVLARLEPVAE